MLPSGRAAVVQEAAHPRLAQAPAGEGWRFPKLKFDRVLADVPCSGDGTVRKFGAARWAEWEACRASDVDWSAQLVARSSSS